MSTGTKVLWLLNNNLVRLTGLRAAGGAQPYQNDLTTVQVILLHKVGETQVAGYTWPLTLTYQAGSDGDYEGTLAHDLTISEHDNLIAHVTGDGGPDLKMDVRLPVVVLERTGLE